MYRPPLFRLDDLPQLLAFMRAHSFATLVSTLDGAPFATHLPLVIEESAGEVVITGHVAKPNVQWQGFDNGESLAIFTGPHAYISPALYEKVESVPTWNYIAVHAYGTPRIITAADDPVRVQAMLEQMMATFEPEYLRQWEGLSAKFREGMMQGIVVFEMVVTRLEGKAKLSQNRSLHDQTTVAAALVQSDDPVISATGAAMQARMTQT